MNQEQLWAAQKELRNVKYRLIEHYRGQIGSSVIHGPFRGLVLPQKGWWNCGDHVSKVFGFYEACLHPVLYDAVADDYLAFLDIGCADGYYITGFARLCPSAKCIGFDVDAKAQEIARQQIVENQLKNCEICGLFDAEALREVRSGFNIDAGRRLFIKCDIEGAELELFNSDFCSLLSGIDLLIEVHDFFGNTAIQAQLRERLAPTHDVRMIAEAGRNPNACRFLSDLPEDVRWLIISEGRWTSMSWMWARFKSL